MLNLNNETDYQHQPKFINSNVLVLGRLIHLSDVYINTNDFDTSYIKLTPLSYKFFAPKGEEKNKKIQVFLDDISNLSNDNHNIINKIRFNGLGQDVKQYDIFKSYNNLIFIIKPSFSKDGLIKAFNKDYFKILCKKNTNNSDRTFAPVPIFSKRSTCDNINNEQDFINTLSSGKDLGYIYAPWPINKACYPSGIIWKENNNKYDLFSGSIIQQNIKPETKELRTKNRTVIKDYEKVAYNFMDNVKGPKQIDIPDHQYIYKDIAFLSISNINYNLYEQNDGFNDIRRNDNNKMGTKEGFTLNNFYNPEEIDNKHDSSNSSNLLNKSSQSNDYSITNSNMTTSNKYPNNKISNNNLSSKNDLNIKFIHKLEYLAYKDKLYYSKKDLINFHAAMKTSGLVVLAGLSGTGKSSLINLYAEALGINYKCDEDGKFLRNKNNNLIENKDHPRFKFIPVRPFWTDDSDLLGYVDTIHSIYQPAASGLVNTLVEANKKENRNKLYLVTFDEMNLARVEYYFSQFLSVLEESPDHRYINLYNPDLEGRLYNSSKYPARIKINNNVLFVGTINMDESTHKFSDKVLDRSNIINLKLEPFTNDDKIRSQDKQDNINYKENEFSNKPINTFIWKIMKKCNPDYGLDKNDKRLLWKIHKSLHNANHNLGVGRRIVNQINEYLMNIPKFNSSSSSQPLSREEAFDLQIVQRVITKIRGSEKELSNILDPKNINNSNNLINILEDPNININKYDFSKSKLAIERKFKEIQNYGFTI